MVKRIITAFVSLAVFAALLFAGEMPFKVAVGVVIIALLYEIYSAVTNSVRAKICGYICGVLLIIGVYADMTTEALVAVVALTMAFLIFLHGRLTYRELFGTVFATVYITLFTSFIPRLMTDAGIGAMMLIFMTAWVSDTAAYFCGTFLGKHKLIPDVSPKKTVEGAAGAVIITALICAGYAAVMDKSGVPLGTAPLLPLKAGILGAFGSALSQLGDLAASAIKRDADIKDYGTVFPGHGGFMDRFDSVIYIAPMVYYYVVNFML